MTDYLTLMVCPHDTANNPDRWYLFVQYLTQKLGTSIHFDIALDFADFHERLDHADLVYANPADSLLLIDTQGFVPLVRPANVYDEVVFVANHAIENPTLESLQEATIASVESMLATCVGLRYLSQQGIEPAGIADYDSWLSVIGGVWREEASFGIIYKDTYDELSEQGKSMAHHFATSNERVAFHCILAGRKALDTQAGILQTLIGMDTDERGMDVLKELHIPQWIPVKQDEIDTIRTLGR